MYKHHKTNRIYLEMTEGVRPEDLARFSTLEPTTGRWYTTDSRVAEAWKQGIEVQRISLPPEGQGDGECPVESLEDQYQAWRVRFQGAAQSIVEDTAGKSYGPQVYCALNGFCQYLRARASEVMHRSFPEAVDWYFYGGVYADSTERMYRRWIRKTIDRMEVTDEPGSDAGHGPKLGS